MIDMIQEYRDPIAECCKSLKLSAGMADRAMVQGGDTHPEFLLALFQQELENRRVARITHLLNAAGFPRRHIIDLFVPDEIQFPPGVTLDTLKSLQFYHEGKNIIMYGSSGTGKTMLSICLGMEACMQDIPAGFFRTAALVNKLSECSAHGNLNNFLKKLYKNEIIILDEFGYVPYDRNGIMLLFDILSEIHEHKTVILNTNLEFSRWVSVLYDENMTAALVSRLLHHCHLLVFPGQNRRLLESSVRALYDAQSGKE